MKPILKLAKSYNLYVIEDSAEAHGITPVGDVACFSFFGNKIISTGEGGMCITNNKRLSEQMKLAGRMCFDDDHSFLHKQYAFNMRMTNVQAAIGCAQVQRFAEILKKRKQIETWYNRYLPEKYHMPKRNVLWMFDVKVMSPEIIRKKLLMLGVDSRLFFKPMSMQPMYKSHYRNLNAYKWSKNGLYLPTYTEMTKEDVKDICSKFLSVV